MHLAAVPSNDPCRFHLEYSSCNRMRNWLIAPAQCRKTQVTTRCAETHVAVVGNRIDYCDNVADEHRHRSLHLEGHDILHSFLDDLTIGWQLIAPHERRRNKTSVPLPKHPSKWRQKAKVQALSAPRHRCSASDVHVQCPMSLVHSFTFVPIW